MHELDNPETLEAVVAALRQQLGVPDIAKIASGNEFYVFKADLPDGPVVIKVPKDKVFSNVNDAYIDSRDLISQEYKLSRHVMQQGVRQIAEPLRELNVAGFAALVLEYVPSDDSRPSQFELGQLLARIHSIQVPDFDLSAQEGMAAPELVVTRLQRRWTELKNFVSDLPELPSSTWLLAALEDTRDIRQLLHMDFREANFRIENGKVRAVIDWSNALIGHPALELARVAETGETTAEFVKGYASVRPIADISPEAETIFQLDTATMLALVFLSEEPNPERARVAVERVMILHEQLERSFK